MWQQVGGEGWEVCQVSRRVSSGSVWSHFSSRPQHGRPPHTVAQSHTTPHSQHLKLQLIINKIFLYFIDFGEEQQCCITMAVEWPQCYLVIIPHYDSPSSSPQWVYRGIKSININTLCRRPVVKSKVKSKTRELARPGLNFIVSARDVCLFVVCFRAKIVIYFVFSFYFNLIN